MYRCNDTFQYSCSRAVAFGVDWQHIRDLFYHGLAISTDSVQISESYKMVQGLHVALCFYHCGSAIMGCRGWNRPVSRMWEYF